uniref:Metaxin n=2 Tax=Tetradesmus obliquus TaxID=3088 RepID=A0A383WGR9_TETOB|eukprot:jgi/Sobl393_1/7814/SZX76304.1
MTERNIVLYKWPGHAGLPSLTAASLQAEAALRLAKVQFFCQECSSSSTPTGVIPALDLGSEVPAASEAGDLAAARAIIAALAASGAGDLDAWLAPPQRAELLAFATLLQAKLDTATHYTTWIEKRGFGEFRKAAYGSQLPFPLSYIVPWSQRNEMAKLLGAIDGFKAYQGAVEVLSAVADRLRASPGRFFFGDRPSSLDALLFGHLAFYRHSPVAAPVLRDKVGGLVQRWPAAKLLACTSIQRDMACVGRLPVLASYVDGILEDFFATAMPPPPMDDAGSWSDAAQGASSAPKPPPTVEDVRMWRGSQYWLAGAAAAVGGYVLLGGHYFSITTLEDDEGEGMDDDDDDDVQ